MQTQIVEFIHDFGGVEVTRRMIDGAVDELLGRQS